MRTDYLVKGCGAMAMAFVDVMLRETDDFTFTMVDKRAAPGGHWNDAYPFVRLHQPSSCYGVASRELGHDRKDTTGFNQGLYELASGIEVANYFHQVMRDTLLPSGRVSYYPMSELVSGDDDRPAEFVSLLSGERHRVDVSRSLVDATMLSTSIPLTHRRKFEVADGVACIPPNDLTRMAANYTRFAVLGAGKTAIDSVIWLLANGANPDAMSWVLPRDPWLINRANVQPGQEFFEQGIGMIATQYESAATATSIRDMCEKMDANGVWLRIDPTVWPTMIHGATVTVTELEQLRRVRNKIRKRRVVRIEKDRIVLEEGVEPMRPDTLYVDCTARALGDNVGDRRPVFSPGTIRLQMVRQLQPTFSAAMIGHIEATVADEAQKQKLAQVTSMTDTVADWIESSIASMTNQASWTNDKELRNWIAGCRLDMYGKQIQHVREDETGKRAALARLRANGGPAVQNMQKLLQMTK